jgi:hypothetical protein
MARACARVDQDQIPLPPDHRDIVGQVQLLGALQHRFMIGGRGFGVDQEACR